MSPVTTRTKKRGRLRLQSSSFLRMSILSTVFLWFFLIPPGSSSLLPFNIGKQGSKEINEFLPSEIVKFKRFIKVGEGEEKLIPEVPQKEAFEIDEIFVKNVSIKCLADLDPYFSNSTEIKEIQTSWIYDDGSLLSSENTVIIDKPTKNLKVRCEAKIAKVPDLETGTLLSRSIEFRKKPFILVEIEPRMFHVTSNAAARLVCRWPPDLASNVIWKRNGEPVGTSKNVQIETIKGKSVLHILQVKKENVGEYRCLVSEDVVDQKAEIIIDETAPEWTGVELEETSGGPIGGEALLECLIPGSKKVIWTLERSLKLNEPGLRTVTLGNSSVLVLRNISKESSGRITCTVETSNESAITMETDFKALDADLFNYKKSSFSTVTKKQGIAMSVRCETYDILGETPEMAMWYLNSKPVPKNPYIKTVRSEEYGIGYTDLLIGIVEEEHAGLYTCIVQGPRQERIKQVEFIVDVTTNQRITNLTVTTDHEEKCIELEFDLPEKTELSWAHFTTYFVVVYKVNDSESLNSLPGGAMCNHRGHCHVKDNICNLNGEFEEATDYVFRISMVLSGAGTVITPLSDPVVGRTWDGAARKSLPLEMTYLEDENAIEIRWDRPDKTDVKGRVVSYVVQVMNYSEKMTNLLSPVMREYHEKDFDRTFRVENLTKPFAYKFRVTPLTRSRKLPFEEMSMIENFPFLLFTSSDDGHSQVDESIPVPEMNLKQLNLLPVILVSWKNPKAEQHDINKVIIRYQHILNFRSKFVFSEHPIEDEKTEISKSIESGFVYQVCSAFMRKSDKAHGSWKCSTIPLKNHQNNLVFLTEKEALKKKQLPLPILCDKNNCKCTPSRVTAGGMRVEWEEPLPATEAEYFVREKPKVNYIIHYSLNETDLEEEDVEIQTKGENLFAELPALLPNKTYRIMIEALNELGDGVDGTYFSCSTPAEPPLPPPRDLNYVTVNSSHIALNWTPPNFHGDSLVDGYIIFVQKSKNGSKSNKIFVQDSKSQSHVIGKLRPGKTFYFSMISHSPVFGDSTIKSEILQVKMPEDKDGYLGEDDDEEDDGKKENTLYIVSLYSAVLTVTILLLFLLANCCYFCCFVRVRRWRRRQEQERIQRMKSNASSALTLKSEDSRDVEAEQVPVVSGTREVLPLLNLPPDPPGFDNPSRKDTKGPVGGPRPLGNKRFKKLMKDPEFLERIAELNRDPTGIGLPPLMRDQYYMQLQKENDRKFREVAAREWEEIRKSKQVSEEKKKKDESAHLVAETSFNGTGSPPTSLKDEFLRNSAPESKISPTSMSMTELNEKKQNGLSLRSHSIAFYYKFFRFRKPSFSTKLDNSKNASPTSNGTASNHPPASSLPNLADSGIVFDDQNGYNGPHSTGPMSRSGDRSGSATLVDEAVTPPATRAFCNMRDCRRQKSVNECLDGTSSTPPTIVP